MTHLPQFVSLAEDGVYEFYLDHTLLASARMCEARFDLDHIQMYKPKTLPWALDFGTLVHLCMEFYHKHEMTGKVLELKSFLEYGSKSWRDGGMINMPSFLSIKL